MQDGVVAADERRRSFHTLDGLRGVAAAAVVMLHNAPLLAPLSIESGYLAVDLFFLMSGFVIAFAYDARIAGGGMSAVRFLRLRVTRLYPLYWLALILSVVATVFSVGGYRLGSWSRLRFLEVVAASALMLPTPYLHGPKLFPLNPFAWSLFIEIVVNIAYVAVFKWLRGSKLWIAVAVGGALLLTGICRDGTINCGFEWPGCWWAIPRTAFSFLLGVAFCRLHRAGRLPRWRLPPCLLLAMLLGILMACPSNTYRVAWEILVVSALFPAMLCTAIASEPARPRFYTMLGEASYPAYILQSLIMTMTGYACYRLGFDLLAWRPWSAFAMVGVVLGPAWIAAVTFDPWARRRLGRLLGTARRD